MKKKPLIISVLIILLIMPLSSCSKKTSVDKVNLQLDKIILPKEKDGYISVDLYYANKDNTALQKEERYINKEEMIGEQMLLELINGPSINNNVNSVFPKNTKLISFSIKDSIAYVNLSYDAKSINKNNEGLALMSLSETLSQLPSVTKVQILINSNIFDTLAGGYNISKPYTSQQIDSLKIK